MQCRQDDVTMWDAVLVIIIVGELRRRGDGVDEAALRPGLGRGVWGRVGAAVEDIVSAGEEEVGGVVAVYGGRRDRQATAALARLTLATHTWIGGVTEACTQSTSPLLRNIASTNGAEVEENLSLVAIIALRGEDLSRLGASQENTASTRH